MASIDVFSGVGGTSLVLERCGAETVAYCECDPSARKVLASRFADGSLHAAPVHEDVRSFAAPAADIVVGGFPCQDVSDAGHRVGLTGERSALVWHLLRIARESGSRWLFIENVPGFVRRGLEQVERHLVCEGWSVRYVIVAASEVGLPHLRKRCFVLARNEARPPTGDRLVVPRVRHGPHGREPERLAGACDAALTRGARIRLLGNAVCVPQACLALARLLGGRVGTTWEKSWNAGRAPDVSSSVPCPRPRCPTPIASDGTGGSGSHRSARGVTLSLSRWVRCRPSRGKWGTRVSLRQYELRSRAGRLSAEWTEWVMGFPPGHTRVERDR